MSSLTGDAIEWRMTCNDVLSYEVLKPTTDLGKQRLPPNHGLRDPMYLHVPFVEVILGVNQRVESVNNLTVLNSYSSDLADARLVGVCGLNV
jgi:hypothetical protein